MPTTPENQQQTESALKKAAKAITSPKYRRIVIGLLIIAVILTFVVVNLVRGDGSKEEPTSAPSTPIEVTVTPTETAEAEELASGSSDAKETTSKAPKVITEDPEPPAETDSDDEAELDPADYPPGAPENRGGLPEEFPLVDSFVYTGMEEEENRIIINGTVEDATQAILTLDANLLDNYRVEFRKVDNGRNAGRYDIDGPKLPAGTQVIVQADGTFQVRVPQE